MTIPALEICNIYGYSLSKGFHSLSSRSCCGEVVYIYTKTDAAGWKSGVPCPLFSLHLPIDVFTSLEFLTIQDFPKFDVSTEMPSTTLAHCLSTTTWKARVKHNDPQVKGAFGLLATNIICTGPSCISTQI